MIMKWSDEKNVTMVYMYHNSATKTITKRDKEVKKPQFMVIRGSQRPASTHVFSKRKKAPLYNKTI